MKKFIVAGLASLALVAVVAVPNAKAETQTVAEQIAALLTQLKSLQEQLSKLQGEVHTLIKSNLTEGTTDEDVKKVQEILASDPTIYPEGKVTGFYGPLTREAIKRFQTKFDLDVTGTITDETQKALETLLEARFGEGKVPPGLLHAPGIRAKFEKRLLDGKCDGDHRGKGPFCKKMNGNDDENDDEGDDTETNTFHVNVEVKNGDTTVSFKLDGKRYEVEVHSTTLNTVLDAVADKIKSGDTASDLDSDLADKIESELQDALN